MAFSRVLQTIGSELFVMPVGGGEVHQLTNDHAQVSGNGLDGELPRGCVFFDAAEFVSTVAHPGAAGEPQGCV